PPTTARSTITRWATSSAADHSAALGLRLHCLGGIASAARKKLLCVRASLSPTGWIEGTPTLNQQNTKPQPRPPAKTREPVAAPAPLQRPVRTLVIPPAACRRSFRTAR